MKRTQPRRLRDRRTGKSPYQRHRKAPYSYSQVPLHQLDRGLDVTAETVAAFKQRHGIHLGRAA
jgi:hypothetical protein